MSKKSQRGPLAATDRVKLEILFDKVQLLGPLFGQYDQNLIELERQLGVYISARGNRVQVAVRRPLRHLRLLSGHGWDSPDP